MNLSRRHANERTGEVLLKINLGKETDFVGYTLKILDRLGELIYEMLITQPVFQLDVNRLPHRGVLYLEVVDECSQILEIEKFVLR